MVKDTLLDTLVRWEGAVNATERDGDDSDAAIKELNDSRAALMIVLRKAIQLPELPQMIAQEDDPELLEWLAKASERGGSFVSSIAQAGLVADYENYQLIRPLLLQMRIKYPEYEPSDLVKQEIKDRKP